MSAQTRETDGAASDGSAGEYRRMHRDLDPPLRPGAQKNGERGTDERRGSGNHEKKDRATGELHDP